MSQHPEHEKLVKIQKYSQEIGDFVDWLSTEKGIILGSYGDIDVLYPDRSNIRDLLAEYFKIDQEKLEEEKRQMLKELRDADAQKSDRTISPE